MDKSSAELSSDRPGVHAEIDATKRHLTKPDGQYKDQDVRYKAKEHKIVTKENETANEEAAANAYKLVTKENVTGMTTKYQHVRYQTKQSGFGQTSGEEHYCLAAAKAYQVVTKGTATELMTKHQDVKYKAKQSTDFDKASGGKITHALTGSEMLETLTKCREYGQRPKLTGRSVCGPCLEAMFNFKVGEHL